MSTQRKYALLASPNGAMLPPVPLTIDIQYQFCVDAGASAATAFLDDSAVVGLHVHIACSMQAFISSVRHNLQGLEARAQGVTQMCIDAFAAGYLGRIQQELKLFHGEIDSPPQDLQAAWMLPRVRVDH